MNLPTEEQSLQLHSAPSAWIVPGRRIDALKSFRNHRSLAVVTALTILVLGLAGALLFGHAKYRAVASVRVLPTYDTRLETGLEPSLIPNIEYRSFVQQQVFEIGNPETIIEALKLLGPKAALWQLPGETDQHAAERLLEFLKVEWVPDTFLITVSLQGTQARGLDQIVNAVVDAYLSRQERQELSGADTHVKLLEQRKSDLQGQVNGERAELGQLAQELGVSTFVATATDPYNRKLSDANLALEREQSNLIIEQAHLAALEAEDSHPADADVNALAQKILLDDRDVAAQKSELGSRRESIFLQLQGLAPSHPGRPVLEREIANIDEEISLIDGKAMKQARAVLLGTRTADIHDRIISAKLRVDQAERARDGIEQEVATLKTSVAAFGAKYNHALALHEQYENHLKALSEIDDRIEVLRLQSQSPGVASLELPAQVPDKPEGGKRKVIAGFSIVLAMLFGVLLPTLVDLTDSRVRSSKELESILQMPVLGSTLGLDTASVRDTLRRIALSIIRERRQAGTRVFVVTGVTAGAGTSSLTLALSNELTELGTSTVAVEANAGCPDIRFQKQPANGAGRTPISSNGLSQATGRPLHSVGEGAVAERSSFAVCAHTIVGRSESLPDRIAICQHQKHDRLAMKCVREVLELGLQSHDVVLVDAPPILTSADTTMLVQNPAGVIVVVRAERDHIPEVTAAIQELNRLSPPVVGVVLRGDRWTDSGATARVESKRRASVVSTSEDVSEGSFSEVTYEGFSHLS